LTEFGHRYAEYKEWASDPTAGSGDEEKREEEDGEPGGDFGSGFGQTDRGWYESLSEALHRCSSLLTELDEFGKARFKEAGEKPPRYSSFAEALKRMTAAGDDLLGRKPAPPKPVEPVEAPNDEASEGSAVPAATSSQAGAPGAVGSVQPTTPEEAAAAVAAAARVLRKEKPGDPSGFLLPRALRWGEVRAGGGHVDPRILEAPTTAQRTQLKSLFLDKKYDELLEASEELCATPVGRGWLDLQRYAVICADKLGPEYKQVGPAIRSALQSLLRDVTVLLDSTLMDDSPTASRDTANWLEAEGLTPGPEGVEGQEEKNRAAAADQIIREAGYDRASAMAYAGDPEGAVEMLMERAEHERSDRSRFITKAEAAAIMVEHGMSQVARPILDELLKLIDHHKLEAWEPAEVVAKPMGLLIRCLDPDREGSLKDNIHPRLAKLDPLLAIQVTRSTNGEPGTQGSQQAESNWADPPQESNGADPPQESNWADPPGESNWIDPPEAEGSGNG
jgi:type VI secretion system protein ImpA